jgi:diguanylate cyclase (GGDEF)-like protein/PAS domain S-box-containing protein
MNSGRLSILLVDDDEDDYLIIRDILDEIYDGRYELEWLTAYEPAWQSLFEGSYDVCLLDYHLGAHTGLELIKAVVGQRCRTPIILLTGNDDRDVDVEAMKAGAADYLVKGQFGGPLLERSIRYAIGYAAERQRTLEALRRSEERYALAVRGANDGLWDWDLVTDRIYYAPRWKSMLGYEEDAIGEKREEWFGRVHPLDIERVRAEVAAHFSGQTEQLQTEHRMLHDDGTYRWVLTRGIAVRDPMGNAIRAAGSQTDISQRKLAEDRLLHDAFHDALTGLPNRALLLDRLQRSILRTKRRSDYHFAVMFLDLDGFKLVNDGLGHLTGDQLLIAIGRRLEGFVREGDTVARLGGDEFIILVDEVENTADVLALADRVLEELQVPFSLNGHQIVTSASIGIALCDLSCDKAENLLRDADIAMYAAKRRGKAGYVVFDKAMHTLAVTRLKLEADLRQAALRNEFRLHYQPIVSLRTGRITSFEALVRWDHPERGLVAPDDFIPIAEETKLILPLGMWVLREATEQLCRWQSRFWMSPPLSISVNLSCRQFFQTDLVYQIERILLETGLDARCLRMEITESVIMDQVETALAALGRLKALGVTLAIDDFGKGYSSLSYLHQFPCSTLKIDRSFIARIGVGAENGEIVRTIVSLAESLGMEAVGEGVETPSQLTHLRELGCHYGQGYIFSRPLTAEAAEALLLDNPRWFEPAAQSCGAIPGPHVARLPERPLRAFRTSDSNFWLGQFS